MRYKSRESKYIQGAYLRARLRVDPLTFGTRRAALAVGNPLYETPDAGTVAG